MKKQLYIITAIISLGLSSCSVDEHENPKATDIGFNVIRLTAEGYGAGIAVADIAYKAELWFSAPTMEQRIVIKDLFFPTSTVRITEDNVIEISAICKINTNGTSLKSPNAKWSYTSNRYKINDQYFPIEIKNIDETNFRITVKNLPVPEGKSDFTLDVSTERSELGVSGSGTVTYTDYGTTNFKIEKGALIVSAAEPVTAGTYNDAFTLGAINISWQAIGREYSQAILANYKRFQIEVQTEGESESYSKKGTIAVR